MKKNENKTMESKQPLIELKEMKENTNNNNKNKFVDLEEEEIEDDDLKELNKQKQQQNTTNKPTTKQKENVELHEEKLPTQPISNIPITSKKVSLEIDGKI